MSFEIYIPNSNSGKALKPGMMALDSSGKLTITKSDLIKHGITKAEIVVLIDTATRRIAIRTPAEDDPVLTLAMSKGNTTGRVSVRGALKLLRVADLKSTAGRYPISTKENIAFITLGGAEGARK